jgi:hypothetical protein
MDDFYLSQPEWDSADKYGKHKTIMKWHKDILKPMFDWMNEQEMPQECQPTFDYFQDHTSWEIRSIISFELPDEHAMLFLLKFGKRYDYRT